jgi:hypothetical protein
MTLLLPFNFFSTRSTSISSSILTIFLLLSSHLITISSQSSPYIFVLKSPIITEANLPEEHLSNKVHEFLTLLPSAKILHIYSHLAEFEFFAFAAECSPSDFEILDTHFMYNLKFYEQSSFLEISRSLVKTVPFVSQFLRSETHTLAKNGFCTFSYESYDTFLKAGIHESGEQESMLVRNKIRLSSPLLMVFEDIYVVDTGIQSSHVAFGNRVFHGFDAISDPPLQSDPNGHGTQVAGKSSSLLRSSFLPHGTRNHWRRILWFDQFSKSN